MSAATDYACDLRIVGVAFRVAAGSMARGGSAAGAVGAVRLILRNRATELPAEFHRALRLAERGRIDPADAAALFEIIAGGLARAADAE